MLSQKELQEILYESLVELGLTENERGLYTLSLSLGPATLTKLAEIMGMPRPNVYKVIEGLESKGLAKFSERKKFARTFIVEAPTTITELLRHKHEKITRFCTRVTHAMPDLLAMYSQGELPTTIKVLQGTDAYLNVFYQILDEEKTCIDFCGSVQDYLEFLPQADQERWTKKRVARGTRVRVLSLPSQETERIASVAQQQLREIKYLPPDKKFETAFQLFGNKVVVWQPRAPLALLIEDQYIVKMLRMLFETMWEHAEKNKTVQTQRATP